MDQKKIYLLIGFLSLLIVLLIIFGLPWNSIIYPKDVELLVGEVDLKIKYYPLNELYTEDISYTENISYTEEICNSEDLVYSKNDFGITSLCISNTENCISYRLKSLRIAL